MQVYCWDKDEAGFNEKLKVIAGHKPKERECS